MVQKFITIDVVTAIDMTSSVAFEKGYLPECYKNANVDGVEFADSKGAKHWRPLSEFKMNAFPIHNHNQELVDSVKLMLSEDYKERFIGEFIQVRNRYFNLKRMVEMWDNGILSFTPTCSREIYNFQLKGMLEYMDILVIRARIEGIELPNMEKLKEPNYLIQHDY